MDWDRDADLDLMVISDFAGIDLYENQGKGKFQDVTDQLGKCRHSFGRVMLLLILMGMGHWIFTW